jgi:4-aminobutyrate aminotransferase/(S)-3-amino-2-methylpropionate transaminase
MVRTEYRRIRDDFSLAQPISNSHPSPYESISIKSQLPIKWDKAVDFTVYDKDGNRWIDLTSGIFAANAGHSNPDISEAIKRQIDDGLSFSFMYPTDIRVEFAEKILAISPKHFEKVVLLNTGSEATDTAYKMIKHWAVKNNRKYIVCFKGSYHGRVLSADLISNGPDNSAWSGVVDEDIIFIEFPYDPNSKFDPSLLPPPDEIAGFILETYQGWSSQFYPQRYFEELYSFIQNSGCLLCFDEVQAGFYRMGSLYGYMSYDRGMRVRPDIICLGKAVASPMPMSVVLSTSALIDGAPKMGGTHSGNPLCCAAAIANIKFLSDSQFQKELAQKIRVFEHRMHILEKYGCVDYVNARGLVGAVLFKDRTIADKVVETMVFNGVMPVHTWSRSIKIGPPLTITEPALEEVFDVIDDILEEIG